MTVSVPLDQSQQIADLYQRIADLERRASNKKRTGLVHEVNAQEGWARVKLGEGADGKPYLTPKLPWKELAMGKIKTHFPPSAGEQVDVVSETGDLTDAMIDTSLPSNANPRPHDKEGEGVVTVGNARLDIRDGLVKLTVGGTELVITADGITLNGQTVATKASTAKIDAKIDHTGDMTTSGTHRDVRGLHGGT